MENKTHKVIFENLQEEDITKQSDKSLELVHPDFWKDEIFHNIYFQRTKKFTSDNNELKSEFLKWHKAIGLKYYNPELKKFMINYLPIKMRLSSSGEILRYINMHPLLTFQDKKNLNIIKQEIFDKYLSCSISNTIFGIAIIYSFSNRQATKTKEPLAKVIRKHYVFSIAMMFLSFVILDAGFRYRKHNLITESLYQKNMVNKYFQNYLIDS